ncbi:NAD(P)/FAD-dependent oxidoreductase [Leucobacter chromiireducens]|uniref:FAD-binding oxidoreductase n=1 Tax=Leucobacter chromiireducens subsp. solipictus TaxID=398235 RepID=A0ABS1SE33_9MICO|nr:FAD-binding oxidoreductase [Leucobacter chromiireducens]MBL3678806.1 FAD-binding oxidoreductase [Leucobacter chromiireducens subsp. solipictus]
MLQRTTGDGHIVVGAGIVGASVAYHLSALGQRVTLIESGEPGSGVSGRSFGWVGRPPGIPSPTGALRHIAQTEYRRLESEIPDLNILWTGSLTWDGFNPHPTPRYAVSDAHAREPRLRQPPGTAYFSPDDGAIDPAHVARRLVSTARDLGAVVHADTPVTGLVVTDGRIAGVRTSRGNVAGRSVILAAGAGSATLFPPIGRHTVAYTSPAVLVRLRAEAGLVRGIVGTADFEVRQFPDGTLWCPREYSGEQTRADRDATARATIADLEAHFARVGRVEPISVEVGWRPMIADGEPLIGPHPDLPGLTLAVMHQGVTLGAAVGRVLAEELVSGVAASELAGCRPARFSLN